LSYSSLLFTPPHPISLAPSSLLSRQPTPAPQPGSYAAARSSCPEGRGRGGAARGKKKRRHGQPEGRGRGGAATSDPPPRSAVVGDGARPCPSGAGRGRCDRGGGSSSPRPSTPPAQDPAGFTEARLHPQAWELRGGRRRWAPSHELLLPSFPVRIWRSRAPPPRAPRRRSPAARPRRRTPAPSAHGAGPPSLPSLVSAAPPPRDGRRGRLRRVPSTARATPVQAADLHCGGRRAASPRRLPPLRAGQLLVGPARG
jgi:hypothetical protein